MENKEEDEEEEEEEEKKEMVEEKEKRRRKRIIFTRMNIQLVESTFDFSFQYSMKKASCHLREIREKKG